MSVGRACNTAHASRRAMHAALASRLRVEGSLGKGVWGKAAEVENLHQMDCLSREQ